MLCHANCSTCFVYYVTKLKESYMAMDNIFFPRKDRQTDRHTDIWPYRSSFPEVKNTRMDSGRK